MIRVFSIEDHKLVTNGLRTMFRGSRDGVVIACSAETMESAMEGNKDQAFDIILLDLFIPGTDPLDNIKQLMARYPCKPVVILTAEEQLIWKLEVADAGVVAYLTKHSTKKEMLDTLMRVYLGENILQGQMAKVMNNLSGQCKKQLLSMLKPSEKAILYQLALGFPQKQIARNLKMSESSIEKILKKLRKQYSASNSLELVRTLEKGHFFPGSDEAAAGH